MYISSSCTNLVKKYEGFRSKPYKCPANVWTIGYGSTFYLNGNYSFVTDYSCVA